MSTSDGAVIGSTQIFGSAPRNRAFNVVLLAEGFTAAQQADFNTACGEFSDGVSRHTAVRRIVAGDQHLPGERQLDRFRCR